MGLEISCTVEIPQPGGEAIKLTSLLNAKNSIKLLLGDKPGSSNVIKKIEVFLFVDEARIEIDINSTLFIQNHNYCYLLLNSFQSPSILPQVPLQPPTFLSTSWQLPPSPIPSRKVLIQRQS